MLAQIAVRNALQRRDCRRRRIKGVEGDFCRAQNRTISQAPGVEYGPETPDHSVGAATGDEIQHIGVPASKVVGECFKRTRYERYAALESGKDVFVQISHFC